MAELQHQGIVRVIEKRLEDDGFLFFVMEYLAGGDLRRAVLEKRLLPEKIPTLLQEMAAALQFAHEHEVIHRDVKPSNVLLDDQGRSKLTDFDLVRAPDTTGGTLGGGMLGTFLYCAPEAMSAPQEVGPAADLYSLAMTVVFCLYGADLPLEVLQMDGSFLRGLPCSARTQAILRRATNWDPRKRFGSAAEFSQMFEESLSLTVSSAGRSAPPGERWIDRAFWSSIDIPLLRQSLQKEYFGADQNQALQNLLKTIDFMQRQAKTILDPESFHRVVQDRWMQASVILLWGEGGTGKTYLSRLLAPLVYGHPGYLYQCQGSGWSQFGDQFSGFRSGFYGTPPGYQGSDRLTDVGRHLAETGGFTVITLDEVDGIVPGDFGSSLRTLFDLLWDRTYLPSNASLTWDDPISLWNTIFVLTANLPAFPPPGLPREERKALTRRISAYEIRWITGEAVLAFAQWYLLGRLESMLKVFCTCGDLSQEIRRLGLGGGSPYLLSRRLAPILDVALHELEEVGISPATAPPALDVTAILRQALSRSMPHEIDGTPG
jgi:hypothetical protein